MYLGCILDVFWMYLGSTLHQSDIYLASTLHQSDIYLASALHQSGIYLASILPYPSISINIHQYPSISINIHQYAFNNHSILINTHVTKSEKKWTQIKRKVLHARDRPAGLLWGVVVKYSDTVIE